MAHSPSFSRTYSNPASRLAYERPWFVVVAVLAIFAFYVVSGNYSLTRPLTLNEAPSFAETGPANLLVESGARNESAPFAETSSASHSSETGAQTESGIVSTESATLSSAPATVQQASTAGVLSPTIEAAAQRWATAGILLVAGGQAWDEVSLANVDAALSLLSPGVLAGLGNPELGPLHILVNTEGRSLSGSQPYGGAANYFSTNDGINELVLYPAQRVSTVLHELGHAYNLRATPAGHYAQVLVDPEMENFLASTSWRIVTPRETVATALDHTQIVFEYKGAFIWPEVSHFDPLEDYANAFALYYTDPEALLIASPERYGWMAANLPR
jgi:hypothetical protein